MTRFLPLCWLGSPPQKERGGHACQRSQAQANESGRTKIWNRFVLFSPVLAVPNQAKPLISLKKSGRGERIRTSGLYVPNVALYLAKLHPALTNQSESPFQQFRGQLSQGITVTVFRQPLQSVQRALRLRGGRIPRCLQGARFLNDRNNLRHLVRSTGLNGLLDGGALQFRATLHRNNEWQCRLAFAQVVAQVLTHCRDIAVIVQHIIYDLKCGAQRLPIVCAALLNRGGGLRQQGGQT